MTVSFIPVATRDDQRKLADLAGEIWRGYWPAIIGEEQTEYMVEKFQSFKAIKHYMAHEDYEYWFLYADGDEMTDEEAAAEKWGRIVGFTGGRNEPASRRYFISKIYLLPNARGHGFARRVIEFYEALCSVRNLRALYLTVNKHNELGIRAYNGTGFITIDAVKTDIGHGFVMDDFIMQKDVEPAQQHGLAHRTGA